MDNERFKFDLHRAQKSHLEQNERIDKLKKQNEALESRVQELKKICDKEKSDNKELRSKLRVSEYERTQLSSKEGEVGELKKALHALDAKRRDELRDRDRRVAEVEKILSGEKKKRDALASRLAEANGKREGEVHAARDVAQTLEAALRDAKAEAERVKKSLAGLQARSASIEEALLGQLEQHRDMLSRVADEYGRLASSTVSRHEHSQVKFELAANQLRVLRLERKLANAEAQVIEVANLVRHTKDENKFFARILFETEREAALYATEVKELSSMVSSLLQVDRDLDDVHRDLDDVHRAVGEDIQASEQTTHRIETGLASKFAEFHKLRSRQLLLHSSAALKQLDEKDSKISAAESQLAKLLDELTRIREKETSTQHQLHEATTSLAEAQGQIFVLKSQLEETKATTKAEVEKMERVVTQEKEAVQRLVSTVTQSRRAEEALQEEVEQYVIPYYFLARS